MNISSISATPAIKATSATDRAELIRKTAQDFGTIFVSMMLKAMRKSTGDNEFMPASFGEKLYTEMLDDKYADMMSANTLPGFNELVAKELERLDNPQAALSIKNLHSQQFSDQFASYRTNTSSNNVIPSKSISTKIETWQTQIDEASEIFGVDSNLIKAVIAVESAGNPIAISRAGAKGLMQLMDKTAVDMGVSNSFSPQQNINGGVKYLSKMLGRWNGNEQLALASYNAGPSAVDKYKGIPPYKETQNYVLKVLRYRDLFAQKSE